jgi:hypothetical protein
MAQRHTVQPQTIRRLVQQVTPLIDTERDYKVVIRVEDGQVHIGQTTRDCYECEAYDALMEARAVERSITQGE